MRLSLCIPLIGLLAPETAEASNIAVWNPTDAAAAAAWLSGIGDSASRQDSNSFYYFSTNADHILSDPIIANLSVWSDRAELNILGIGTPPSSLQLWQSFLGIGSILEIPQSQLALANPEGGASYFSYTSSFPVEDGFSRITFNSAARDGLLLIVDSGTPPTESYSLRLATIPEPTVAALSGIGAVFFLQRRRNRRGEQAGTGQPATRSQSKSEGGGKPQPEAEWRSR